MAKQLTNKQLETFDELRTRVMSVRRKMLRRRKRIEETKGGRMNALPALVIPKIPPTKKHLLTRLNQSAKFREYIDEMKLSLRATKEIRYNFFFALRDIVDYAIKQYESQTKKNLDIDLSKGRIKKEDVDKIEDETIRNVVEVYRQMFNIAYGHNGLVRFLDMYERGYIVQLRWLYDEVKGSVIGGTFTEEQFDMLDIYRKLSKQGDIEDITSKTGYKRSRIDKGWGNAKTHKYFRKK